MFIGDSADLYGRTHNICVVGAGPVGLIVALELARHGLEVTLLESGTFEIEPDIQALSHAITADAARNTDMMLAVQRRFGGTSNLWGAGCVPLDPIDFERRTICDARWPISYDEFARYLPDACRYAHCGLRFALPVEGVVIENDHFIVDRLMRYADPPSFLVAYRDAVARSRLIRTYLGATATGMRFGPDERLAALEVRTRDGRDGLVRARAFVLACGGVETARLLLAVQAENPGLFGGAGGPLGRYYMGHLSGAIAEIRFSNRRLDRSFGFFLADDIAYARRRITASAAHQQRASLPNVSFWPTLPAMRNPDHRDPILSLAYLALSFPPLGRRLVSESLRRINIGDGGNTLAHLRNVLFGAPSLAGFLPQFLYRRLFSQCRLPGLHFHNAAMRYPLHFHAEHLPNAQSRVRLSEERDVLGLRKAVLDLRFSERDAEGVVRSHAHLARWLEATGLGELIWQFPAGERIGRVMELAGDGVHQIGTVRMGADERTGVVDGDCRVFGSGNLFVAGSAVFPTSGQANPTLSSMALGVRLARHLSEEAALLERVPVPLHL